jgi:hypothetical protein
VAAFTSALDDLAREYPQMPWLRGTGAVVQSLWIIDRVRGGTCPDPEAEFRPLLAAAPPQLQSLLRYNLACGLAQLAAVGPADRREENAAKAVAVLNDLLAGPFFRTPARAAHLDKDPDLDPLRDRDDFKQFLQKAKAGAGKK